LSIWRSEVGVVTTGGAVTSDFAGVACAGNNKTDITNLRNIIQSIEQKGAQAIIIGCTELSIPLRGWRTNIHILDSTEIYGKTNFLNRLKIPIGLEVTFIILSHRELLTNLF